jgi:hypothetical protein
MWKAAVDVFLFAARADIHTTTAGDIFDHIDFCAQLG